MRLLEPFKIGDVELKNRVVMSPMITNFGTPEGYPTETHIRYFVRRSSLGLLITEYTYVNRTDARGSPNELGLYTDEFIPKFARLTEAVHNHDTKIFVQLVHVGRKTRKALIWGNSPIAPSNIPLIDPVREMTKDDINRVIDDFVKAAERAEKSGFDGIELHGAHGYLIAQFLSPATNKREDEYRDGVKFLEEIIKEVKRVVSIPVGLRISATEFDAQGLNPETVGKIVKRVENLLDYLHLSAGRDGPLGGSSSFYYKEPSYLEEAKVIRNQFGKTLLVAGSILTVDDAEKVLEFADAAVLARQILADPDWLIKVKDGGNIRPCIRCNQLCRLMATREVRCDVNPELGWELVELRKGEGEVNIVGGGVTGLEMARVLAKRGFEVKLYEKDSKLGGQLNEYKDPYKKASFIKLLEYYEKELKRLGVKVYLNSYIKSIDEHTIFAVPSQRQPTYQEYKGEVILVDSNLYAYQDYIFEWVKQNEVYITRNLFKGLDRNRGYLLEEKYKEIGVREWDNRTKPTVHIHDVRNSQQSIGQSISKAFWYAVEYDNSRK
ncbi:NADH oxidase [Sulfolobus acidocaldarius SUSAZ]|nr:NADH oxidase [Sulfolobus acidocaldarius SUSAZ]